MGLKLMATPSPSVMEASFHERDEQILYRLVMVFRRVPNRVNIRLPKFVPTGFAVRAFGQREKSKVPRCLDDGSLFYLAKRMKGSIDRKTASKEKQTRVGNQYLKNLSIVAAVSIARRVFAASKDATLSAIRFAVQPKKAMGFICQSARCLA